VLITDIQPGVASRGGLTRGDVIVEVNRKKVSSITQLREALSAQEAGDPTLMLIRRREGSLFIVLETEE